MAAESKSAEIETGNGVFNPSAEALGAVLGQNEFSKALKPYHIGKEKRLVYGSPLHLASRTGLDELTDLKKEHKEPLWLVQNIDLSGEKPWRAFLRFWLEINALVRDGLNYIKVDLLEFLLVWPLIRGFNIHPEHESQLIDPWLDSIRDLKSVSPADELAILSDIVVTIEREPGWQVYTCHLDERLKSLIAKLKA